jgi:hypothetical protein
MTWLERTLGLAALVVACAATGCSPYGALCVDEIDCEGGNDADIEACEIRYQAAEDVAAVWGCEDRWDDYVFCLDDRYRCSGGNWTHDDICDDERKAFENCAR